MSDATVTLKEELYMTPQTTPSPTPVSAADLKSLEKAYLEEIRSPQPDIARMRALRSGITRARRRLERELDILPPHTD